MSGEEEYAAAVMKANAILARDMTAEDERRMLVEFERFMEQVGLRGELERRLGLLTVEVEDDNDVITDTEQVEYTGAVWRLTITTDRGKLILELGGDPMKWHERLVEVGIV